jgi:hypothetical protein
MTSPTERLPTLETDRARNAFLRIRQPERLPQDLTVDQAAVTRQHCSDPRGNRIVLLPMPANVQFRLFARLSMLGIASALHGTSPWSSTIVIVRCIGSRSR